MYFFYETEKSSRNCVRYRKLWKVATKLNQIKENTTAGTSNEMGNYEFVEKITKI